MTESYLNGFESCKLVHTYILHFSIGLTVLIFLLFRTQFDTTCLWIDISSKFLGLKRNPEKVVFGGSTPRPSPNSLNRPSGGVDNEECPALELHSFQPGNWRISVSLVSPMFIEAPFKTLNTQDRQVVSVYNSFECQIQAHKSSVLRFGNLCMYVLTTTKSTLNNRKIINFVCYLQFQSKCSFISQSSWHVRSYDTRVTQPWGVAHSFFRWDHPSRCRIIEFHHPGGQ